MFFQFQRVIRGNMTIQPADIDRIQMTAVFEVPDDGVVGTSGLEISRIGKSPWIIPVAPAGNDTVKCAGGSQFCDITFPRRFFRSPDIQDLTGQRMLFLIHTADHQTPDTVLMIAEEISAAAFESPGIFMGQVLMPEIGQGDRGTIDELGVAECMLVCRSISRGNRSRY